MKKIFIAFVLACLAFNVMAQSSDGIIAHWDMNGTGNDVTGHGHNGTLHAVTTDTGMAGLPNTAYSFDGMGSYISVPYSPAFNVNNYSILAVVKVKRFFIDDTIVCNGNPILSRGKIGGEGSYGLSFQDTTACDAVDTNKEIFVGTASFSLSPMYQAGRYYSPQIVDNIWYRVVETFNDTAFKTYINGTLVATSYITTPGVPMATSTDSLDLGYEPYDAEAGYPYSFI